MRIPVEESAIVVRRPDGEALYYEGALEDITDRKLAERQLAEYAARLQRTSEEPAAALAAANEANEMKSRFLGNMSHEIRTPSDGVVGTAELLFETDVGPEQRQYLSANEDSVQALVAVINDILDLSRSEAGKLKLESVPFDPESAVRDTVKMPAITARAKGLALDCRFAPSVAARVRGDPVRLRRVLANLIGNAVRFPDQG